MNEKNQDRIIKHLCDYIDALRGFQQVPLVFKILDESHPLHKINPKFHPETGDLQVPLQEAQDKARKDS